MRTSRILVAVVAVAALSVSSVQSSAQGSKVGALTHLRAWIDGQSPGHASIHVTGDVTARNPCYEAVADFAGAGRVKIVLRSSGALVCAAMIAEIPFSYTQANYVSKAKHVTVFSEQDWATIPVQTIREPDSRRVKTVNIHIR